MEQTGPNTLTMTIRIPASLQATYSTWSKETGISRNRLINLALRYGLKHIVVEGKTEGSEEEYEY